MNVKPLTMFFALSFTNCPHASLLQRKKPLSQTEALKQRFYYFWISISW